MSTSNATPIDDFDGFDNGPPFFPYSSYGEGYLFIRALLRLEARSTVAQRREGDEELRRWHAERSVPQWEKQQRPLDPDHTFCVFLQDDIPSDASYGECGTCKACFHFPDLKQYFNSNSIHKCPVCREDWSVWTEWEPEVSPCKAPSCLPFIDVDVDVDVQPIRHSSSSEQYIENIPTLTSRLNITAYRNRRGQRTQRQSDRRDTVIRYASRITPKQSKRR